MTQVDCIWLAWNARCGRAYHQASCAGWANDENMEHFLNSIHCLFIKSLPVYEWSPEWQLCWPPRWGVEACAGRGLPTFSSKSSGVAGTSSTPASLETPPNALVTHLMTMTTITWTKSKSRICNLAPFSDLRASEYAANFIIQFWRGPDRHIFSFVNWWQNRWDRVCRELFAGQFNWKLRWFSSTWTNLDQLGPTWTNGRWRSLIFSRLHLKPKQVKECLDVEVENHRNLNLFLSQEWVVAHKKDTHVCSIRFQETCVRLLVASKLWRPWRPKGSVLLGRRFWYLDLCLLLLLSMYSHSKGHTWSFLVVNQADAE